MKILKRFAWIELAMACVFGFGLATACKDGSSPGLNNGNGDDEEETGMCDDYPDADNNFLVGSVVRNYDLFDADGEEHPLCDYGGGTEKLALLVISAGYT